MYNDLRQSPVCIRGVLLPQPKEAGAAHRLKSESADLVASKYTYFMIHLAHDDNIRLYQNKGFLTQIVFLQTGIKFPKDGIAVILEMPLDPFGIDFGGGVFAPGFFGGEFALFSLVLPRF